MTTTSHRDCPHPPTKAARAACRKSRAAQVTTPRPDALTALIDSYYFGGADLEEIASQLPYDLAKGYYDNSLDAEDFIASLCAARDAR